MKSLKEIAKEYPRSTIFAASGFVFGVGLALIVADTITSGLGTILIPGAITTAVGAIVSQTDPSDW